MKERAHKSVGTPQEESSLLSRRQLCRLALASAASAMATGLAPNVGRANETTRTPNPFIANHYGRIRNRIRSELNAGSPVNHPLAMAVKNLPNFYYDHDVQNKIIDRSGINIPTPSLVFEMSKQAWLNMKDEAASAKAREEILQKLQLAAQPGVPMQQRLQSVHDINKNTTGNLKLYWEVIEKEADALVKRVQGLVLLERTAARSMKTPSQANEIVTAREFTPMTEKGKELKEKHAKAFDDYADIEPWLRPFPYECDLVSANLGVRPSSIIEVESVKALKVLAQLHLEAAVQRKEVYHSIQSYVQRKGPSARPLLKYDGTRHNDRILMGWLELLREQKDASGKAGPIESLLENVVYTVQVQSTVAETIKRCKNRD